MARLALICGLALILSSGAAHAHAVLIESHPADGAVLREAPAPGDAARLPAQDRMTVAAVAASRALFLAALLIAAGGILALWRVAEFDAHAVRRARRIVVIAEISALVFGALSLGIAGCSL